MEWSSGGECLGSTVNHGELTMVKVKLDRWYHGSRGNWAPGVHEMNPRVAEYLVETFVFAQYADAEEPVTPVGVEEVESPVVPEYLEELVAEKRPPTLEGQLAAALRLRRGN